MPTSIRFIFTFSVHLRIIALILSYSSLLALYKFLKAPLSMHSYNNLDSSWLYFSVMYSQISPKKLVDCLVTSTRMLPPWQSAWMKLFFISI